MLSGNIRSKGPHEVHMEEGPIGRTLLLFAVPILISQLLQELYGIADTLVVGRFIGGAALAATGIGHMPMSVIINFLIGFSSGLSVITSHLFGAREYDRLRRTIRTVNLLSCLIGLAIMVIGIIF
ncbi:MAG: MATE family efflux transporter, partial [Lachnospiraceae bacterium]|nr:MATE family efflux transporter [Lachnospiraceae bacterium]